MLEIIGGIYFSCMTLSIILLGWHYNKVRHHLKSRKLENINKNLTQLNLFWSVNESNFASLKESSPQKDAEATLKSVGWMGLLSLASFIGLILLAAIIFTSRKLSRSRLEIAVFKSDLASSQLLDSETANRTVSELKGIGR